MAVRFGEYLDNPDGTSAYIDYVWLGDVPLVQEKRVFSSSGTLTGSQTTWLHVDHLNTPRIGTDDTDAIVWRWDSDPFGVGEPDSDPDGDSTDHVVRLRFPGQYADEESGHYYSYFRDYDAATGRYAQADPIGLRAGLNRFTYALGNPNRFFDPLGLDIAVIEQGPTDGNPIGHTAVAITGQGVYSYGNSTPAGSSLQQYLAREAPRRDTRAYIVPTSPVQDMAALQYLQQFPDTNLSGDWWDAYFGDNCSVRSVGALEAAGISPVVRIDPLTGAPSLYAPAPNIPGAAGYSARSHNPTIVEIPQGSTTIPGELNQFEPAVQ